MDFDYRDNPFDNVDDSNENVTSPLLDLAAREYRRVIEHVEQQVRQSDKGADRSLEFSYMAMVFLCKVFLYFLLQDAYEREFYSANL